MLLPLLALLALPAPGAPLEPPPLPGEPLGAWRALADAPPTDPLTAEEAVRIALERNGDLRARLAEVDRARGARMAARALPNPSAELELWDEGRPGLGRLEAEYALSDALLAPLRARPAGFGLDRARLQAAAEGVRLGFEVRRVFHAAQAAERRVVAAMQAVDAWAAGVEAARALYAAGNVPELDLALQEAEYERARVGLAAVELELVATRERLARVLGGEVRRPLAPLAAASTADLPAELDADLEDRAVAASLELEALDAGLDATRASLSAARVDAVLPDFGVYVESAGPAHPAPTDLAQPLGATLGTGAVGTLTTHGGGDPVGAASEARGGWGLEAGLHLTVPLFGLGRGEIVELVAERSAGRSVRDQREVEVRSAARELRARLISAHDRAVHFEAVVLPARERVSRQTLLQHNAMQVGLSALLDARRQELEARATHAELLAEWWTARAALDALLAGVRVDAPASSSTETPDRAADAAGGH